MHTDQAPEFAAKDNYFFELCCEAVQIVCTSYLIQLSD